jgi:hypothetical protein
VATPGRLNEARYSTKIAAYSWEKSGNINLYWMMFPLKPPFILDVPLPHVQRMPHGEVENWVVGDITCNDQCI